MKEFPKFEGDTRFRAEQLMEATAFIDPADVPQEGIGMPLLVGYEDGKPVYETVWLIVQKTGGHSYLMVA